MAYNQDNINHRKVENELENVESKINRFFIKTFGAYRKFSTDCSQAVCFFFFSFGEMVRLTITQRLSIFTPLILL